MLDSLQELLNKHLDPKLASVKEAEDKKSKKKEEEEETTDESEKEASLDKLAEDLYAAGEWFARGTLDTLIKQAAALGMAPSAPGNSKDKSHWFNQIKKIQNIHSDGPMITTGKSNPGVEEHAAGKPGGLGPKIWEEQITAKKGKK
jgi:hypothetical protein